MSLVPARWRLQGVRRISLHSEPDAVRPRTARIRFRPREADPVCDSSADWPHPDKRVQKGDFLLYYETIMPCVWPSWSWWLIWEESLACQITSPFNKKIGRYSEAIFLFLFKKTSLLNGEVLWQASDSSLSKALHAFGNWRALNGAELFTHSLFIFKIEFENGNAIEAEDEADSGDSSGLDRSVDVLYNKFFGSAREYSP